jgi:hypothetical protein
MQPVPPTAISAPEGEEVIVLTTAGCVVPAWLIVMFPPCGLETLNVRVFGPKLGPTLRFTTPLPVPEAPETIVIAVGSLLVIVQSQPGPYKTSKRTDPPPPGTTELPGLKEL